MSVKCKFHRFQWTSLVLNRHCWGISLYFPDPNIMWLYHQMQQKSYELLMSIWKKSLVLYCNVLEPYQSHEDKEKAYGAILRRNMVTTCVSTTAVFSCGRCACLCALWLGPWSWSGRPELHPVVPALSLLPEPGSSAASASAHTHNPISKLSWRHTHTHLF